MAKPKPSRYAAALQYLQQMRDRVAQFANTPGTARPDEYQERFGLAGDAVPSLAQSSQAAAAFGRGASRAPYRILGAPVDISALGMSAAGYPTETPVGGSDWMIDQAARAGLAYPRTDNAMEAIGDVAASFVNPVGPATRIGTTIERGVEYAKSIPGFESLGRPGGNRSVAEAQRAATRAAGGTPALIGTPTESLFVAGRPYVSGLTKKAVKAAESYASRRGTSYAPPKIFRKVIPERATKIADAYDAMSHTPNDPKVKAAYDAMIDETLDQWNEIKKSGLKVEFIRPDMPDPYAKNPRAAIMDVRDNNHLWVLPTESGFGGTKSADVDISGNPLLRKTGEVIDGVPVTANDIFRIVHDYFGHIKYGHGFRADGEENAWRAHSAMYSPLARKAMTTETRGQNSWVNYGPYGEQNRKASAADTQYAPQKTGLLPDWVIEEGLADEFYPETPLRLPPTKIAAGLTLYGQGQQERK
jgi:hypothetical protein